MVNKLQNKFAACGKMLEVSLPQIVVVGCQSAGKSSVLESVIGREFLPRGSGVVTRRPTMIQLQQSDDEYVTFLHKGEQKYTDYEAVRKEISDETFREPGPNGFSSKPISLKVYAPDVLKLTIVDLPGIVKLAVGEQTEESVEEVRQMVLRYIEQPHCIILAICPANQDLATCDSLEIAKIVDPKRERTLGVLTKLDLMDSGTHATAILKNEVLPLSRGFVGVVNRSQRDIDEGKSIDQALIKEKHFFENHPAYIGMAKRMGSVYLRNLLHVQLREHIRTSLPALRKDLSKKLNQLRRDLKEVESLMSSSNGPQAVQSYVIRLVQKLRDDVQIELFGHSEIMQMERFTLGAVMNNHMHEQLSKILALPITLSNKELAVLIANENGVRNFLTVPSPSLEAAVASVLKNFKEPMEEYVSCITDLLFAVVDRSTEEVRRYPSFRNELVRLIAESIEKSSEETKDLIGKHLKAEMSYCNVYNQDFDFSKCRGGLPNNPVKIWNSEDKNEVSTETDSADRMMAQLISNENSIKNVEHLSEIIQEYMSLVKKQVTDVAVKYVICFLVRGVSEFINKDLVSGVLSSANYKAVLDECSRDFQYRDSILATCSDLEEALNAIHSF